ncbi:MAG: L,D-transpeptidase [Gammaproteobacteria bacterium]|nr:L,D-transpeptidase [Gammaproteobacteria bacterium]
MTKARIQISLEDQRLYHLSDGELIKVYPVSTARNGPGELNGSECTPAGRHIVRARIGDDQPAGTVFVARRPTGEIFHSRMLHEFPERDWILTRILWLSGTEVGVNRLGPVDTMRRYIYIHGTPDEIPMGVAASHGCVRMRSDDIMELYEHIPVGTEVTIVEGPAGL